MSAISGIFIRNGNKVDHQQIIKMNESLNHKGPDGSNLWIDDLVGLGHQMLFTTHESLHENLPYEENNLIITADARIDNRKELSEKLGIQDVEDVSDSYFILKAYQKWGENCPEKLLGDFVFVIWEKTNEKLFCARDHMGIKPFYYFISGDIFLFASEVKAILKILEFKPEINKKRLAQMLVLNFDDKENSFYNDVFRLPPASKLTVNLKHHKLEEYWSLDPDLELKLNSDREYQEAFLEIFTECVRCRLRSVFPVGFELSGGLDTSSATSIACKLNEEEKRNLKLNSYTTVFKEPKTDESYYAKSVVRNREIEPHFLVGDGSPLVDIEQIIKLTEVPLVPFNNYSLWQRCFQVQKDGNRILLTGACGDNVLAIPHPYLTELARTFHWIKFFKELSLVKKGFQMGYWRGIKNYFLYPLIPQFLKNFLNKFIKNKKSMEETLSEILFEKNPDFAIKTDINNMIKVNEENEQKSRNTLKSSHYRNIITGIIPFTTEFDHNLTAKFLIEIRYPYLDKRLVEFCYSLPSEMKVKNGWDKYIIRSSLTGVLPEEVQWRRHKTTYASNFYENFFKYEKSKKGSILFDNAEILEKFVDVDKIMEIYEKYKTGILYDEYKKGNHDSIIALWLVLILALWLQNGLE